MVEHLLRSIGQKPLSLPQNLTQRGILKKKTIRAYAESVPVFVLCLFVLFKLLDSRAITDEWFFNYINILMLAVIGFLAIRMPLRPSHYGLNQRMLGFNLKWGAVLGVAMFIAMVIVRCVMVECFDRSDFRIHYVDWEVYYRLFIYPLVSAGQEIIIRGFLLISLCDLFESKHSENSAVLISSLIFGALHIIAGFWFFVGSLIYGVLVSKFFLKSRSVIGVSIIHYFAGVALMSYTPY